MHTVKCARSSSVVQSPRWLLPVCATVLVLATAAAYWNTFRVPFLLDDKLAIAENPSIRNLANLPQVLLPEIGYGITTSGRPLLNLSLALCYAVSGPEVWSYHALNLLIHALAGLALFGVVRRTVFHLQATGRGRTCDMGANEPTFLAFAVAVIWTLHPLQTEAVTYIIQRTESMMGLYFLLTFYAFVRAVSSARPWIWRGSTILACLAAAVTKEVAATAPLLVFLYDRTFIAGSFRQAWRQRHWLHLSLAATWVPLALLVASTGWNRGGTAGFNVGISPWSYWCTQCEAIVHYLRQSVWPHPLVFEYGKFWVNAAQTLPFASVLLPLLAATILALWRWPVAGFLGAWFFIILAPTSVVPGTLQMIVEHRMYLPLAAVVAGAVFGMRLLWAHRCPPRSRGATGPYDGPFANPPMAMGRVAHPNLSGARPSALLVCLATVVPLGILTRERNGVYRDELSLWRQTVNERPTSALAQSELGTALYQRGRVTEALEHYRASVRLDPNFVSSHYNLAIAYAKLGRWRDAVVHDRDAIRINPQFYPAHFQLALGLLQLGRPEDALPPLAEVVKLNPTMAEAHYERGVALARTGRMAEAVDEYQTALRLKPGLVAADCDLGSALLQLNQVAAAVTCLQRAVRENPRLADAHFNLGLALARVGSAHEAMAQYAETVRLDPAHARAQYNLGLALGNMGRLPDAIDHLRRAVEIDPRFAEAHYNLGVALAMAEHPNAAVGEYEAALRLQPDSARAHHGLGMVLLKLHQVRDACTHFEAALRIDPRFAPARAMLQRLQGANRDR